MNFVLSPPEKGTYVIEQENVTIVWNAVQKWSTYHLDEIWTGDLADDVLWMRIKYPDGDKVNREYFYIDYNTCPF